MRKGMLSQLACMVITSSLVMNGYAAGRGLYMGLMMGPATNTAGSQSALTPSGTLTVANPKSSQFGSRVYLGYKMNPYAGFEGGFTYFSKIQYDTRNVVTCSGTSERARGIDFVGKGSLPLSNFDIFAKAGVSGTYITNSGAFSSAAFGSPNFCKNSYTSKIAPTVSIGASYDINQNWVTDVTWTRIMVGGIISNIDFYALGISYHFVDLFCGQFLC